MAFGMRYGLGLAWIGLVGHTACGTSAGGVATCRQVEEARCRRAPACNIPLQPPYHTSGSDVDACIRLYDDACLHGLEAQDPGPVAVNACVAAIQKGPCSVVQHPETASGAACAWLVPPPTTPAPGPDAASDAPSDADADAKPE